MLLKAQPYTTLVYIKALEVSFKMLVVSKTKDFLKCPRDIFCHFRLEFPLEIPD